MSKLQDLKYERYGFLGIAFMVITMVFIGGLTRLTGSGLSIVEWKPIMGILPPLTRADWVALFTKYQASPEFIKINYHMDIEAFKGIFWLEYIHRVWGRLIGFVLLIPTISVLKNPTSRHRFLLTIVSLWILGGFQGFLGWYMVKSGLIDDPHVSPYRLTVHLGTAFLILWITLRAFMRCCPVKHLLITSSTFKMRPAIGVITGLVTLTALYGGLVAGHKAGLIYNTFPLMDGEWFPEGMGVYPSIWQNLLENPGVIQFMHRILALTTLIFTLSLGFYIHFGEKSLKLWWSIIMGLALLQVTLGILTLLYQVPVYLAAFHQLIAVILFSALILCYERVKIVNEYI